MGEAIAFYTIAACILGFAVLVVSTRDTVHSVLFLVLDFLFVAALYVLLGAEFLAVIQILVNILDNAVKFTDPGGRITLECSRGPSAMIDIAVTDSGVGIPAAQIELVFDHFHQVQGESHHTGGGGLGLGLAISRRLAHMMQGDIVVESEIGQGSRVTIRIPSANISPELPLTVRT